MRNYYEVWITTRRPLHWHPPPGVTRRIRDRVALVFPHEPMTDRYGLRMEMLA
jgi:hypothetical protein